MALTDQELLVLDNFMYFKGSADPKAPYATLGDMAQDFKENPNLHKPDSWSLKEYNKILDEIIESDNLKHLGIGEPTNEATDNLVRGRCFIEYDGDSKEVTGHVVAFRGTGGAATAWRDNFEGLYEVETKAQEIAKEYIQGLEFDDITVTGHSKGGNLAMYTTIMCGGQIDRCVSYDGQGFGENFLNEVDKEQLEQASAKMKSVSTHNDYVNILLTPVADEIYYVANEGTGFVGRHSSYPMYESNEAALDANGGMFTDAIAENRDYTMSMAHYGLESFLILFPEDERNLIADVAGNLVGQFVGKGTKWEDTKADLADDWNKYLAEKKEDINDAVDYVGDKLEGAKDSVVEFGGSIVDSGKEIGGGLAGLGIGTWGFLKNTGSGLAGLGENFGEGFDEIIAGNFKEGLGEFGEGFKELGGDFLDGLGEFGEGLGELGEGLWDGAKELGEGLGELGSDIWDGAKDIAGDIGDGLEELGDKAWTLAENAVDGIVEIGTDLGEDIKDFGKNALKFFGIGR